LQAISSLELASIHIEALTQNCIEQVDLSQPISDEVLAIALRPLPAEWFNDTETASTTTMSPTTTVTQETSVFTPALLQNLQTLYCPFDCNKNGTCVNGIIFIILPIYFKCVSNNL